MCHLKPHNVKLTAKFFFSGVLLSLIISSSLCFSAPRLRTHDHAAILYSLKTFFHGRMEVFLTGIDVLDSFVGY